MRLIRILPILLILTACTPARALPTPTSVPPTDMPTITATLVPTSTSTTEPTATPEPTVTPTPEVGSSLVLPPELEELSKTLNEGQKKSLLEHKELTDWTIKWGNFLKDNLSDLSKFGIEGSSYNLDYGVLPEFLQKDGVRLVLQPKSEEGQVIVPPLWAWKDKAVPPEAITKEMILDHKAFQALDVKVSSNFEKASGGVVKTGSILAARGDEFVYVDPTNTYVNAKMDAEAGGWVEAVQIDREGKIHLEDGVMVKLLEIKEYTGGTYDFTEKSGINPNPGIIWKSLNRIPEGYEATIFVFEGYNVAGNDMSAYKKEGMPVDLENQSDLHGVTCVYSTEGDKYARLYIAVVHKVGGKVKRVSMTKTIGSKYHRVFDVNDPVTKDLLPQ